jgi:NADPH-dependent curcumin reductase CurA
MSDQMQRIVLAKRPEGQPGPDNFRLETVAVPSPGEGEVLLKVLYMSLDPYMRGRMDDAKSYSTPVAIDEQMGGGAVGEVIESRSPHFKPGDIAMGMFGWGSHGVVPAKELRKIDPDLAPISTSLGVLGMPGFTGWYGFNVIGQPKAGETLVVGAATGPVGSMVGQLAKQKGLRAVGVAGGADKCAYAVEELGFDACIDHRAASDAKALRKSLSEACPDGIDIYFENVAGMTLDAVLPMMNVGGRIPLCGMIAWYNAGALGAGETAGPDRLPKAWRTILVNRLTVGGFIISDHFDRFGDFIAEVGPLVKSGKIVYREDVSEGLENAPAAFIRMLEGKNFGKTLVKVT